MATLTDGERKVLSLAWQCFKTVPEVDYKKLAELGTYKTAASATSCYLAAKKKMLSTSSTTKPIKITEGENKVLVLAWQCFKIAPTVDYKKLAQLGSYKTPASATSCYLAARKKLLASSSSSSSPAAGVATPTPSKKRKSAASVVTDEGEDGDTETPAPKRRGKKSAKPASSPAVVKDESEFEDEGDDSKPTKIKKETEDTGSLEAEAEADTVVVKKEEGVQDADAADDPGVSHLLTTSKEYLDSDPGAEAVDSGVSDAGADAAAPGKHEQYEEDV